jgi:ATP-dependent Clp protease protease subunit
MTRTVMQQSTQGFDRHMADDAPEEKRGDDGLVARMLATRTVLVAGEVNEKLAERVMGQVLVLDAENHDPIRIVVTSQGGHVDSGFAIHDLLRYVASPIRTIGAGWVASIGVPILLAAPKEHRYSLPNTRFLLHQPSGGAGGQASDIRIAAEEILKLRERINQLIAAETGQDVERVGADSDRNYWMDAPQALEYGLVGSIITNASEVG